MFCGFFRFAAAGTAWIHKIEHGMYVAGGFMCYDKRTDVLANVALLFDRRGRRIGRYDKVHPYSPEVLYQGVTPGNDVPVFKTPLGKIGFMICYDSWFTDVAEVLALKGAEIILFPNAGYYRDLMPARAADNGVRIVASSLGSGNGIWDTTGTEVTQTEPSATCHPGCPPAHSEVRKRKIGKIEMLVATLDLAVSPSPHNWGGPMMSAPGGRRNRRDQLGLLNLEIGELIG
jgi:predicted amidohydrolase